MCESMQELIEKVEKTKPYKGIVGVPYAALPYASVSRENEKKKEGPLITDHLPVYFPATSHY